MCVGRGDKWLLEKRATDGAVCPPGGKIESRQSMYELDDPCCGPSALHPETAMCGVLFARMRVPLKSDDAVGIDAA